jgi:PTS system ascorbate-specific IIA component
METIALKNIRCKVSVTDWKDSIKKVGDLLVSDQTITEEYISAMIDSVNTYGPYMVLMPGFALVHAAPSKAVKKDGLALITLKDPVNFGCNNDPVKVVMCLACVDKHSHMETIQKVGRKLMSDGIIEELTKCTNEEEIYQLIN